MGKTITSIVLVAAAIAVVAIPGVGAAISATLVSAGLSTAAAATITTAITGAVISAGVASAAKLLGIGPSLPKPSTTEGALKTAIPPRVRAYGRSRLYGAYALFETAANGTAVDVFAIHDGQIDGIERRYLGDDAVTLTDSSVNQGADKRYKRNVVQWLETRGLPYGQYFPAIGALLPGIWTPEHRGDGVVTVATTWKAVKADDYQDTYPQGGPVPASIVARWQLVFDWRDPAQDVGDMATWKWSENALLHLAHYRLTVEKAKRLPDEQYPSPNALRAAWATFFVPTLSYWTEAANVCDEQVPLKAGGSEARYRSAFSHKLTDPHKDVIDALTACFDGWTSPRADGALVVFAGRYYAPTVEIGPEHIVSYSWQTGIDDESTVNEITLSYVSDQHDFGTVECDPWEDQDDVARRGSIRSQPLENPVPSWGQARRLAKRTMARLMAPYRGTVTTNVAGRIARGQRYIRLRIIEAGAVFFDGVAEITQLTRNLQTGGVTFLWVAADANIDAWNPATEEGSPAALGNRIAPQPVNAPVIESAGVVYTDATEEGSGGRISVIVSGLQRDDLTWYARWRVQGAAVWNEQRYSDVDPSAAVELLTSFVPLDKMVEVEVAYQTGDGRVSDYSEPALVNTDIDATPPADAVAIALTNWGDTLDLTTDPVSRARSYRWRFYAKRDYSPGLYRQGPVAQYTFGPGTATRSNASGGWDGNFYSYRGFTGEALFIFRLPSRESIVGLSEQRGQQESGPQYQRFDFALYYADTGNYYTYIGGVLSAPFTQAAGINLGPQRLFAVAYKDTTVTFYVLNDAGVFVPFLDTPTTAGRTLYAGGAMTDQNATVDSMQWRADADNRAVDLPGELARTVVTTGRTVSYTAAQAAADGVARAYIVDVAGVNAAGAGAPISSGLLTNPAPAAVLNPDASGSTADTGAIAFALSPAGDLAGYMVAYGLSAGFDPLTQGFIARNLGASPQYLYGLAANTYYAKVAAFDTWSDNPALLNFSQEVTFTLSSGGGSPGGGGGGGGGGGYCVTEDTPVLMADGSEKRAGDIAVGDQVWTQHEDTMKWGAFPVVAAQTVESDDVWQGLGIHATGGHRVWLGGGWVRMRDIGTPAAPARVVRLTVDDAHTYYSAGVLSHNIKQNQVQLD